MTHHGQTTSDPIFFPRRCNAQNKFHSFSVINNITVNATKILKMCPNVCNCVQMCPNKNISIKICINVYKCVHKQNITKMCYNDALKCAQMCSKLSKMLVIVEMMSKMPL